MGSDALVFDDDATLKDVANFIARAKTIENDAAWLVSHSTALAIYVPLLVPADLGQGQFTILGMRVHRLAEPSTVNTCYSLSSLQDRLARLEDGGRSLSLPPVEEHPTWAGISVPAGGWSDQGQVEDDQLAAAAAEGVEAVAQALPANPGKPVVEQVRQRIWASPMTHSTLQLPLGAGFGMHALGFLSPGGASRIFRSGGWGRVSNPKGHVLYRQSSLLG